MNDYFLGLEYDLLRARVKIDLNMNPDDDRYDEQINGSIRNNLMKISRMPIPSLMHQVFRTSVAVYPDIHQFVLAHPQPQFIARIHSVSIKRTGGTGEGSCWVKLRRRGPHDREPAKTNSPEIYEWTGHSLLIDQYKSDRYYSLDVVVEYDGLPPPFSPGMTPVRPEFESLLVLGVLRDIYREILKAPNLFALADSAFNDEYASLREKDLSPYPKTLKTPKTYW